MEAAQQLINAIVLFEKGYNGCMYRTNLEAGRIFYGKNKNAGADI